MKEAKVETYLRDSLQGYGFKVPKLVLPGYAGAPDRLILWPTWSPAPPEFVELKRPGKDAGALQAAVADDWTARGVAVNPVIDTIPKASYMIRLMLITAVRRYQRDITNALRPLPDHIMSAYRDACAIEKMRP